MDLLAKSKIVNKLENLDEDCQMHAMGQIQASVQDHSQFHSHFNRFIFSKTAL